MFDLRVGLIVAAVWVLVACTVVAFYNLAKFLVRRRP